MKAFSPIDKMFSASLKHEVENKWKGRTKALAAESETSIGTISDLKNGKAKASFEKQTKIAIICGYTWGKFIERGKAFTNHIDCALDNIVNNPPGPSACQNCKSLQKQIDLLQTIADERLERIQELKAKIEDKQMEDRDPLKNLKAKNGN